MARTQTTCAILLIASILLLGVNADDSKPVARSENVVKEKPIIIHNQAQHYDKPTLDEYTKCHENLDICLKVCESSQNSVACEAECPSCPLLTEHSVVVQGVNDTDYHAPADTPLNTTNVVRLTNEIRNIIDHHMGNVTARNENNIHVHNNVSTSGGKFGLGYNQNGSCCIVMRKSRSCDTHSFSTAARCHKKRHRVCGERCKARVMHAKRINYCTDDYGSNCYQSIKYVPYRPKRATQRCQYSQMWPFVSCQHRHSMSVCQRCLQIPYGQILSHGMPPQCISCYQSAGLAGGGGGFYGPTDDWSASWQPTYDDSEMGAGDFDDEFEPDGEGWHIDMTKCRRADGSIIEDCHSRGVGDDNEIGSGEDTIAELVNNDSDDDYFNEVDEADSFRRRRQAFRRSSYSRRQKPIIVE